jgi:hypothetical protein
MGVSFPVIADLLVEGKQAVVRDGDAVCVAAEIP